jgi:hypothetical protein
VAIQTPPAQQSTPKLRSPCPIKTLVERNPPVTCAATQRQPATFMSSAVNP